MVSAIIMAGGGGTRSGQSVPKQFLTVNDIPVIVYTMLNLQNVPEIDKMVVVSPAGWENFISTYAEQFRITKLEKVVLGGETRNASIYSGLCALKEDGQTEKVCLIDANRPLTPKSVIQSVIALVDECDCALAAEPCHDSMFLSNDGACVAGNISREQMYKGQTPECAKLDTLLELYESEEAIRDASLSTTGLAVAKGKKVLMAKGHIKSFKITTVDDFDLFKAFLSQDPLNNLVR